MKLIYSTFGLFLVVIAIVTSCAMSVTRKDCEESFDKCLLNSSRDDCEIINMICLEKVGK